MLASAPLRTSAAKCRAANGASGPAAPLRPPEHPAATASDLDQVLPRRPGRPRAPRQTLKRTAARRQSGATMIARQPSSRDSSATFRRGSSLSSNFLKLTFETKDSTQTKERSGLNCSACGGSCASYTLQCMHEARASLVSTAHASLTLQTVSWCSTSFTRRCRT